MPVVRRAWALACPTRMRAGSPRHATIAGDRPPRYGPYQVCMQRSRGTGTRATVSRAAPFPVGRGPVPRHVSVRQGLAGDRPPRYGMQGRLRFTVGRWPVPRHRACTRNPTIAGYKHTRYGKIETGRSLLPNASRYERPQLRKGIFYESKANFCSN